MTSKAHQPQASSPQGPLGSSPDTNLRYPHTPVPQGYSILRSPWPLVPQGAPRASLPAVPYPRKRLSTPKIKTLHATSPSCQPQAPTLSTLHTKTEILHAASAATGSQSLHVIRTSKVVPLARAPLPPQLCCIPLPGAHLFPSTSMPEWQGTPHTLKCFQ